MLLATHAPPPQDMRLYLNASTLTLVNSTLTLVNTSLNLHNSQLALNSSEVGRLGWAGLHAWSLACFRAWPARCTGRTHPAQRLPRPAPAQILLYNSTLGLYGTETLGEVDSIKVDALLQRAPLPAHNSAAAALDCRCCCCCCCLAGVRRGLHLRPRAAPCCRVQHDPGGRGTHTAADAGGEPPGVQGVGFGGR